MTNDPTADPDTNTGSDADELIQEFDDADTLEELAELYPEEAALLEFGDYYDLLGVSPDASERTILAAFDELNLQYHPDQADDIPDELATDIIMLLQDARDVLGSPETRQAYDQLGHDAYLRQSDSLGALVTDDMIGGAVGTESDDDTVTAATDADHQESEYGAAYKRGDTIISGNETAFRLGDPEADAQEDSGPGLYASMFDLSDELSTRSMRYVSRAWMRSWRNRLVTGLLVVGVICGGATALGHEMSPLTVDTGSLQTVGAVYSIGVVTAAAYAVHSALWNESVLPRGGFVHDRDSGLFSQAAADSYLMRGGTAVWLAFLLAVGAATAGASPWQTAGTAIRTGEVPSGDGIVWAGGVSVEMWGDILPLMLSYVFAMTALLGMSYLVIGLSVSMWAARYNEGLRVRPSLTEWVFVIAIITVPLSIVGVNHSLFTVAALTGLPEAVQLLCGVGDGGVISITTVGASSFVVLAVFSLAYRIRLRVERWYTARATNDDPAESSTPV